MRRTWGREEDAVLLAWKKMHSQGRWGACAEHMAESGYTRTAKQCNERWRNHCQPGLRKEPIDARERELLSVAIQTHGTRWGEISRNWPVKRGPNMLKNAAHRCKLVPQRDDRNSRPMRRLRPEAPSKSVDSPHAPAAAKPLFCSFFPLDESVLGVDGGPCDALCPIDLRDLVPEACMSTCEVEGTVSATERSTLEDEWALLSHEAKEHASGATPDTTAILCDDAVASNPSCDSPATSEDDVLLIDDDDDVLLAHEPPLSDDDTLSPPMHAQTAYAGCTPLPPWLQ